MRISDVAVKAESNWDGGASCVCDLNFLKFRARQRLHCRLPEDSVWGGRNDCRADNFTVAVYLHADLRETLHTGSVRVSRIANFRLSDKSESRLCNNKKWVLFGDRCRNRNGWPPVFHLEIHLKHSSGFPDGAVR